LKPLTLKETRKDKTYLRINKAEIKLLMNQR